MTQTYRQIDVERRAEACCARIRAEHLAETEVYELVQELYNAGTEPGCKKLVLSLGPQGVVCLYSVLLARLISLQRKLRDRGCALILCELTPDVKRIFLVCCLDQLFHFANTVDEAVAADTSDYTPGFPACTQPACSTTPRKPH